MNTDQEHLTEKHYARADLAEDIFAALRSAGKNLHALHPDDLAPLDQFHLRGQDSTLELAQLAGVERGSRVLDVGGGIGGPARMLASQRGCSVTVLDITRMFCEVGEELTRRTGLSDRVSFRHGSALEMPFAESSFDLAWTQHSSMNIADKRRLYAEIHRVLRPGGKLAMHEIMAGPVSPIHFPVPWAREPEISFLEPPDQVRSLLRQIGFSEQRWEDQTPLAADWLRQRLAASESAGPAAPLGAHVILGPAARQMFRNVLLNLEQGRAVVVQGVLERG